MSESVLLMLAVACSCLFGGLGVLTGVGLRLRAIQRDEGRWSGALERLDVVERDAAKLRLEWTTSEEKLGDLVETVERKRRRAAASASSAGQTEAPERDMTPQEIRNEIRRGMSRLGGRG